MKMRVFKDQKTILKRVAAGIMAAMIAVSVAPVTSLAATTEGGVQRPTNEDFKWINGISDIYAVPGSGKALKTMQEISGDWKGFLGGKPTEDASFFGSLNVTIVDKGKGHLDFIADWYTETRVDNKTGRPTALDTSKAADTTYTGGLTPKYLFAEDASLSHQFINGEAIKDFVIVNFYQQGNRQYALGAFEADGHKPLGNIFMTRTVSGASLITSNAAASVQAPWSGFAGYFEYKHQDGSGQTVRDSVYIEPISADQAYVVIDTNGKKRAVTGRMELADGVLNVYAASGALFDSMRLVNNNTLQLTSQGASFTRMDSSARAPEYWNHIGNKFAESKEWND